MNPAALTHHMFSYAPLSYRITAKSKSKMSAEQPSPPNSNVSPSASEGTSPSTAAGGESNNNSNNNDESTTANEEENQVDFPSIFTCPISQAPPAVGVRFDVPDPNNGSLSPQVFNRRDIVTHISTPGIGRARGYVRHPLTRASVIRTAALALVHPVSPQVQARIDQERTRLNLPLGPEPPLPSDQQRTEQAMRNAQSYLDRQRGWEQVASDDSSGDEILAVRSPVRRRLNGGGPAPAANVTATSPRSQMGGFLNRQRNAIRSPAHATALEGLLQHAGNNVDGIAANLGQNNRLNYITVNNDSFFGEGG